VSAPSRWSSSACCVILFWAIVGLPGLVEAFQENSALGIGETTTDNLEGLTEGHRPIYD
jgi:hypothetical protein